MNGWLPLIFAALILAIMLTDNSLARKQIRLEKAEWHCVEYAPGASDCTVYRKIGTRAEDAQ